MMTTRSTALAIFIALAVLLPQLQARADWQYTRWGMTIDQVIGASNGALQPCTTEACGKPSEGDGLSKGAFGPYDSGAFKFNAFLFFDQEGKLQRVELKPINRDKLPELFAALRAKYGEPTRSSNLLGEVSTWFTSSDQIILFEEESSSGLAPIGLTKLIYLARVSADSKGL
jgi:hypothetical protein